MALQTALSRPTASTVTLVSAASLIAALVCLLLFLGSEVLVLLAVAVIGSAIAFWISGNLRLACLWCLVLAAPLSFAVHFVVIPHMGGAGSYTIDLVDPFLAILILFILRDWVRGNRPQLRLPAPAWWWGAMILLGFVSAGLGPMRQTPLHEVLRMAKLLVLFLVLVNEVVRRQQFVHVLSALGLSLLVQALTAIAQFVLNHPLGLQILGEASAETLELVSRATYVGGAGGAFRVSGLLGHPNFLSATMAMLLPLFAAALICDLPWRVKMLSAATLVLGSIALVLTLSRSGWIGFSLAMITLLGLSIFHPKLRTRYVGARLVIVGSGAFAGLLFAPQIIKRLTLSDPGALSFRYEWMGVAWHMIGQHPIFGIGLNTFVFRLPGNTRFGGPAGLNERFGEVWPVVHNIYLLTWAEQGTLGFICFVGLHLSVLWVAIRSMRRYVDETLFTLNLGCFGGFLAIMFDGVGSFYIRNPASGRLFWILIGLIFAIDYWNHANAPLRAGLTPQLAGKWKLAK
jgi:O-antigen ligase